MDEGDMGTLRDRKKAETEAALERCALELFEQKGFESTTVDEIVAAAEVSRRTFFRYFDSKEAVIFRNEPEDFAIARRFLADRPKDESQSEAMRAALLQIAEYIGTTRERSLAFAKIVGGTKALEARVAEVQMRWNAVFAQDLARREGRDTAEVRDKLLSSMYLSVLRVSVEAWQETGCTSSLVDLVRENLVVLDEHILGDVKLNA